MANSLYAKAKEGLLTAAINWSSDTIKAALVRGYTPNTGSHEFLSDVTTAGGTIVSTTAALTSKTATLGVADAADTVFTAVPSGAACPYVIVYQDTGTATTSRLIALLDTGTGLPVTPSGADITVTWDSGSNKIFAL